MRYNCNNCNQTFDLGPNDPLVCPHCNPICYNISRIERMDPDSEEKKTGENKINKWIKEHKKLLTGFGFAVIIIILIIVLVCINQCNDSKPPENKGIVTVDSTKNDSITVKVFIKDQNIVFDIPEGYKIYYEDDNSEGFLKGNVYGIGKMNDGDRCTFSLKDENENECSNVKWETQETYPMLEIINNKLVYNKENPQFPPEIICKSTEENEKFKITVTVAKGSADTFCLKKEGERGNVIEQSSGVFENLEPGTYKVWAKNGTEACQHQEVTVTSQKELQSRVTKENIQNILDNVSKGKMKPSQAYDILSIPLQNIILDPSINGNMNMNQLLTDIYNENTKLKCVSVEKSGSKFKVKINQ